MAEDDEKKKPRPPIIPSEPVPIDEVDGGSPRRSSGLAVVGFLLGSAAFVIVVGKTVSSSHSKPDGGASVGVGSLVDAQPHVDAGRDEFSENIVSVTGAMGAPTVSELLYESFFPAFEECVVRGKLDSFNLTTTLTIRPQRRSEVAGADEGLGFECSKTPKSPQCQCAGWALEIAWPKIESVAFQFIADVGAPTTIALDLRHTRKR